MAVYVQWGIDGPKGAEIRKTTRPAHLDWLKTLGARYKLGSPLMGDDGATPCGSIIAVEADSLAEAKAVFAQDPYMKAGLWARIEVHAMGQWAPH